MQFELFEGNSARRGANWDGQGVNHNGRQLAAGENHESSLLDGKAGSADDEANAVESKIRVYSVSMLTTPTDFLKK
jgi:hypothetical protein